ncbi:DUF6468 domain-containing protein [Azospirillum thermophilum]|uniref:DUF6468 domain-containing protein n=1 Tax=Azospirillum thermophilum TaxID=2202148 RepID=UPI0015E8E6F9|nr:DUF6468 domain-containing protein [Azospirillum thermophilum]
MVSFLIDAVLAVMLVTATVFLVIVNKRLRVLKSGQAEINGLITTFSRTIDETDASVKRLAAAATEISAKLADELDRGKVMKEEIGLLLGSCERTARRIEESVHQARALARRLDEAPMPRTRTPRSGMPLSLFDEDGGEAAPAPAAPLTATPLPARPAAEPRPAPVEDPRAAQPAQPADAPPRHRRREADSAPSSPSSVPRAKSRPAPARRRRRTPRRMRTERASRSRRAPSMRGCAPSDREPEP